MQKDTRHGQSREKQAKAAREAGFSNYFSGANQDRALQKDKELRDRSKSKSKKTDGQPNRGWHERGMPAQGVHSSNEARRSADRYSHHSDDEETDARNKVDSRR